MIMAQKHLHELLQEDQEPFQLKHYIANRRCQTINPSPRTDLQVKKQKPISKNPSFPSNFCKNSCFFSVGESPDPRKSPLFDLQSPAKSPTRVFLHVPARTGTLLLEAAVRIQKQSSKSSKSKGRNRGNGFGLFGSVFKRLTCRDWRRKPETGRNAANERVGLEKSAYEVSACEARFSSGAAWSEIGEDDDSLDFNFEPSSSSHRENHEDVDEFAYEIAEAGDFGSCEKRVCQSSFRFVLQISPSSSGRGTPNFTSPATSPSRYTKEDKDNSDADSLEKFPEKEEEEEEEEDKEQCSPVSVLDPSFDEDGQVEVDEGFHLECNYAMVHRATQRLLQKLERFEQMAGLDPVEFESRMLEREQEQEKYSDDESGIYDSEEEQEELKTEIQSSRIIKEMAMKRVWRKWCAWKEIDPKITDEMVEQDLRKEVGEWKSNQDQVRETVLEIELAIFGLLVEELSDFESINKI